MAAFHPEWVDRPRILDNEFKPIWNKQAQTQRQVVYIYGNGRDGNRYCRAVEASSEMVDTGEAHKKLDRILMAVNEQGPSVCTAVDGGDLPRESSQPPL